MKDTSHKCAPWHRTLSMLVTALLAAGCASERDGTTAREQRAADDPGAMLRIAKAAEQSGDLAGAADFYNRAFILRPEAGDAATGLARTRTGLGQPDEALTSLRAAHARSSSDHRLTALLGRLEVHARQPARARGPRAGRAGCGAGRPRFSTRRAAWGPPCAPRCTCASTPGPRCWWSGWASTWS